MPEPNFNRNSIFNLILNKYKISPQPYSLNHPSISILSARTSSEPHQPLSHSSRSNDPLPIKIQYRNETQGRKLSYLQTQTSSDKKQIKTSRTNNRKLWNQGHQKPSNFNGRSICSDLKDKLTIPKKDRVCRNKQIKSAPSTKARNYQRKKPLSTGISILRKKIKTNKSSLLEATTAQIEIKPWKVVQCQQL